MFPECVGSEEVPIQIQIWAEERDNLFFACVFNFERGG